MSLQTLGLTQPERRSITAPVLNPGMWEVFGGGNGTEAGEFISDSTAMQISTVFSCIRILAEGVASLPVKLYRVAPEGRIQDTLNPLSFLLSIAPNVEQTSFTFIETMVAHLALTGNAYAQIKRSADGSPIALWNLQPRQTEPYRLPTGVLAYKTTDGESTGQSRLLAAKDVLHVPLTSWDGICGLSPILQAKRSLGLSIAAEKYGSRLFTNGAVPQLTFTTDNKVRPEDKLQMRRDWETLQTGANQHRIAVLDSGMKIQKLSVTNQEAQFLELRGYSRSEIAAVFKVPLHMVGDNSKLTNANTENMNRQFVQGTLRPYLSRIEAEITKKLLPREPGKVSELEVQFDTTELLRGDTAAQTAAAATGVQFGWLNRNDVRRSMGLNEGGPELDAYLTPVNMHAAQKNLERTLRTLKPEKDLVPND
jgi:HK97 family phage portal protein